MLRAEDVTIIRQGRRLVDGVSLDLAGGQVVALVGPNGAGKSTLLKALGGEFRPTSGRVTLDGIPLSHVGPAKLARRRAVVPQAAHLSFPFTALEVVMLGATVPGFGIDEGEALMTAGALLRRVGLSGFGQRLYDTLSGGEQQRVQIARALCQIAIAERSTPAGLSLLLDEPTSSLDLAHQVAIVRELRSQAARGLAVLVVLHDLNLAAACADEVVILAQGQIAARGRPSEIYEAALLSDVYGCSVDVRHVAGIDAPLIYPAILRDGPAVVAT